MSKSIIWEAFGVSKCIICSNEIHPTDMIMCPGGPAHRHHLEPDTLATFGPEGYDDSVAVDPPLKSVMDGDDIVISHNWDVA